MLSFKIFNYLFLLIRIALRIHFVDDVMKKIVERIIALREMKIFNVNF